MRCRSCPASALVCEQCSFGYVLVQHSTLAGRRFQECVEARAHCAAFSEVGGCTRCDAGFERVRSADGTQVCLEDTNRHFYWYLGVFLLGLVLLLGFSGCFLFKKHKKKRESINNILSKLDLRSLKTIAQRIKRMKNGGASADAHGGATSTYRNLVLEDELDAKKRREVDSQPDLMTNLKNKPKQPTLEEVSGRSAELPA